MTKWKKKKAIRANDFINLKNKEKHYSHKLLKRIKIKEIDDPIERALEHYYRVNPNAPVSESYSRTFLLRLTLNYIRHNYSNYERVIQQIGSTLYNKIELKEYVNNVIVKKYNFEKLVITI